MHYEAIAIAMAALASAAVPPSYGYTFSSQTTALFKNYTLHPSTGGHAQCISGYFSVPVTATNVVFNFAQPTTQPELTQIIVNFLTIDSTFVADSSVANKSISASYEIYCNLCVPSTAASSAQFPTIQFLTHGFGYDSFYWDIASPNNSYIDAAALAGYPTFSYDRLGNGKSDHPDPIEVVQAPTEIQILHTLAERVRGGLGTLNFTNIIGVGHSFGSILTTSSTSLYPKDFEALMLQGISASKTGQGPTFAGFDLSIAVQNNATGFKGLPAGYTVSNNAIGDQFGFYRYPNFTQAVFTLVDEMKQPFALGEIFTTADGLNPATGFTGPVDVVDGLYDNIMCQGNCDYPDNLAVAFRSTFFPKAAAGSQTYLVPGTGHGINAHTTAPMAFNQMMSFLSANKF